MPLICVVSCAKMKEIIMCVIEFDDYLYVFRRFVLCTGANFAGWLMLAHFCKQIYIQQFASKIRHSFICFSKTTKNEFVWKNCELFMSCPKKISFLFYSSHLFFMCSLEVDRWSRIRRYLFISLFLNLLITFLINFISNNLGLN